MADQPNAHYRKRGVELGVRKSTVRLPSRNDRNALILAFDGEYRPGAMGNRDAGFMIAAIRRELEALKPYGLILDFRNLRYEYGDMMDGVLLFTEDTPLADTCPTLVVTSSLNRSGLVGVVVGLIGDSVAQWLFYSVKSALAEIDRRHRVGGG